MNRRRILIVSPYLPHRRVGHGGGTVIYHLCRHLARDHEVLLLCFRRSGEEGLERDLEENGVEVETVSFRSGEDRGAARLVTILDRGVRLLWALASGRPLRSVRYSHPGMRRRLRELVEQWNPEIVDLEYFAMAPYARVVRGSSSPRRPVISLSTHEVETLVRTREVMTAPTFARRWRARWLLGRIRRYEATAARWADHVLCVTEQDRQVLAAISGLSHLHTVPLGVSLEDLPELSLSFAPPPRLLFVGSFDHPPNREAALWIARELVPRLRRHFDDIRCEIVGRRPPAELRLAAAASHGHVVVHGFVDDLQPLFQDSWLFVAPLLSGGGIKIKILEAMGRGMPVLTTPIGLDGIDAEVGTAVELAEDLSAFAESCRKLLEDPDRLATIGRRGRAHVAQHHDWPALIRRFLSIVAVQPKSPPPGGGGPFRAPGENSPRPGYWKS